MGRAPTGRRTLCVVVHDRAGAERALHSLDDGRASIFLVSPRGGPAYAGAAFYVALGRELGHDVVIDATGFPGFVLEALRLGARCVLFRGEPALRRRLDALARKAGARVIGRLPGPCIDAPAVRRTRLPQGGDRG